MQHLTTYWLAGFCSAAISALFWPMLPHPFILAGLFAAACALHLIVRLRWRRVSFVPLLTQNSLPTSRQNPVLVLAGGALAGACWMASVGYWYSTWQLPQSNKADQQVLTVQISASRARQPQGCQLQGLILTGRHLDALWQPTVSLTWPLSAPCPATGTMLTVRARLRAPVGLINPGAWDSQRQFVANRLVRRGTIKSVLQSVPLSADSWHQQAARHLVLLDLKYQRWTAALLVGNRQLLQAADWQTLIDTGTAHLFSISGMHLGLVALWVFAATRVGVYLLARLGWLRQQPDIFYPGALFTLAACSAYTALANWQLPVCRALLLVGLFFSLQALGRAVSRLWLAWVMLAACLLMFPFAVFSASLYLSVGAVGIIWLWQWSAQPPLKTWTQKVAWACRMQLALTVLMIPLTLGWFGQQALLAPLINLLLVPIITVLLPLGLLALLASLSEVDPDGLGLHAFDTLLGQIMQVLAWVADWLAPVSMNIGAAALACVFIACCLWLVPRFWGRRRVSSILLLAPLSYTLALNPAYWYVHVVDAGQGTAVIISRGRSAIILDTGPQFGDHSVARRQIGPLLAFLGIHRVEAIFISHLDNDHAGGLAALLQLPQIGPNTTVATALDSCQAGMQRQHLGLTIRALWPPPGNRVDDNDHSCVLAIDDGTTFLLAPGDIERAGEYALLYSKQLDTGSFRRTDILLAPHHGSQSSSGARFVATLQPRWVVFTQGYNNRWGFPHPSVVQRYRDYQAQLLATGQHGYIRFAVADGNVQVSTASQHLRPRWYHQRAATF